MKYILALESDIKSILGTTSVCESTFVTLTFMKYIYKSDLACQLRCDIYVAFHDILWRKEYKISPFCTDYILKKHIFRYIGLNKMDH